MSRKAKEFIGQEAAWREWQAALQSDRMHHAWLLAGARGLGKHAFARAAAAELVRMPGYKTPDPETHPDILVIENLPADDKEAAKKIDGKPFKLKRNITVDQIRQMQQRLITRPTLGDKRAIVIDPADDLEKGAVNALLKSLEEPPAGTYFILVAHQPGRLLPTVRSRCRMVRFAPLSSDELDAVIRRDLPAADGEQRAAAIAASQGSAGLALTFVEHELGPINDLMERILTEGDRTFALRGALAEEIGAKPARDRLIAAIELARATLVRQLPHASRTAQARIIEAHGALARLAVQAPIYNFDAGLLIMEIGGLLASTAMPREAARPASQN